MHLHWWGFQTRGAPTSPLWVKIFKGLRDALGCQNHQLGSSLEKVTSKKSLSLESDDFRTMSQDEYLNCLTGKKLIVSSHMSIITDPFHEQKRLLCDVHKVDAFISRGDLDHAFVATWALVLLLW